MRLGSILFLFCFLTSNVQVFADPGGDFCVTDPAFGPIDELTCRLDLTFGPVSDGMRFKSQSAYYRSVCSCIEQNNENFQEGFRDGEAAQQPQVPNENVFNEESREEIERIVNLNRAGAAYNLFLVSPPNENGERVGSLGQAINYNLNNTVTRLQARAGPHEGPSNLLNSTSSLISQVAEAALPFERYRGVTSPEQCISIEDFLKTEMLPEKPIFQAPNAYPRVTVGWNFDELKKELARKTDGLFTLPSDLAVTAGTDQAEVDYIKILVARIEFLSRNPLLKAFFQIGGEHAEATDEIRRKQAEMTRYIENNFNINNCNASGCRNNLRRKDIIRDFTGLQLKLISGDLDDTIKDIIKDESEHQVVGLLISQYFNPVNASQLRAPSGLESSSCQPLSQDENCQKEWGDFCGRLSSLPTTHDPGINSFVSNLELESLKLFESDPAKNQKYQEKLQERCFRDRRGNPAVNYQEFRQAYCSRTTCENTSVNTREIYRAFLLSDRRLSSEDQSWLNFMATTKPPVMSEQMAQQTFTRSRIRDAFENFNVDLPNRPSASGTSNFTSSSISAQPGRSEDNFQSENSQAFQALSSFTPVTSSNQFFSPFTTPLGREIASPEELENEVTTRRRALEQSDERISEARDERTRALQQGEQERILQLERQLARLEGERTSERRLLDQYESLLRQVQTPQGSIARQGGSDTNTSASENADTRSSSLNRAPSNVSTFTPQPSLAPRSSETAEVDFAASAGSARLTAPGVDSRVSASGPNGVLDTLRAGKYSGNEASLIVQNRDFTREQTLEVPVNSSEFARAQDGKFDFIVDNSTLRSFAAGKRLGEEFLLRLRTSANDEVEVVVKVLEGGELKFVNSRQLSAQPALQEPNRSPASVNRLPILQGLFEGSP
jgi:hypothetical protein